MDETNEIRQLLNKKTHIQLNLFQNEQEETNSEFLQKTVEQQNEELNMSRTGRKLLTAENALKDREWYSKMEMPADAQISEEVEKDYQDLYGRNIGWNERIKAKREYKKKLKTVKKLQKMKREEANKKTEKEKFAEQIYSKYKEDFKEKNEKLPKEQQKMPILIRDEIDALQLYGDEEKLPIQRFMGAVLLDVKTGKEAEKLSEKERTENEKNIAMKKEVFADTIDRFMKIDMKDFEFNSMEELVEKSPVMASKLSAGWIMRNILRDYESVGGELSAETKMKLVVKIDACEYLKSLSSLALEVYGSPYYASLRSSSLDQMTPTQLEELRDSDHGADISRNMTNFMQNLIMLKKYLNIGKMNENSKIKLYRPGNKMEAFMDTILERRDLVGYAVDNENKTAKEMRVTAPPGTSPSIITMRRKVAHPERLDENAYEVFQRVRLTNQQLGNPELGQYFDPEKTFHGEKMEISRVGGALLRPVKYDKHWHPETEEDKRNHEWNLKFGKNMKEISEGKTEKEPEFLEMVKSELGKVYPIDFPLPDLSDFDDLIQSIEQKQPLNCAWFEKQLKSPDRICDAFQRGLCYSNLTHLYPELTKEFDKAHPYMYFYNLALTALNQIFGWYTSAKYQFKLDNGNNASIDNYGEAMLSNSMILKEMLGQFEKFKSGKE